MKAELIFKLILWFMAAIAFVTGFNDIVGGLESQKELGAGLTDQGFRDPLVDNVFRFFAAVWFGVGVQFVYFSLNLDRYWRALNVLFAIIILGGVARLLSIAQVGWPASEAGLNLVHAGLFAELVVVPLMMIWLTYFWPKRGDNAA